MAAGTAMEVVYARASLSPARVEEEIRPLMAHGLVARTVPDLPAKLLLTEELALRQPGRSGRAGRTRPSITVVRPGPLYRLLLEQFRTVWRAATPLTPAGRPAPVDRSERELLHLLAGWLADPS